MSMINMEIELIDIMLSFMLYFTWEHLVQPPAPSAREESPGFTGQDAGEIPASANSGKVPQKKNRPHLRARVKRRGKSPPAVWATYGPGKPHPEQGRIGEDEAAR